MRRFLLVFFACAPALAALAQIEKTNATSEPKKESAATGITLAASVGTISAPFVLTNGYLVQPEARTELGEGGKAVYDFVITNAGDYVLHAIVNAPAEDSNSFFLNIDGKPEDPLMIWDIDPTNGFENRLVSWRGDGSDGADQFAPKIFKLSEGRHQLIIFGREPDTQLKSISIRPAKGESAAGKG